ALHTRRVVLEFEELVNRSGERREHFFRGCRFKNDVLPAVQDLGYRLREHASSVLSAHRIVRLTQNCTANYVFICHGSVTNFSAVVPSNRTEARPYNAKRRVSFFPSRFRGTRFVDPLRVSAGAVAVTYVGRTPSALVPLDARRTRSFRR